MNEENKESSVDDLASRFLPILEEAGTTDPEVLPLEPNSFAEALIVATASSRRQARGAADSVIRRCKENGIKTLGVEGYDAGDWILVDCGDAIINIFLEDARNLYKLEELWSRNSRLHRKEAQE